MKLTYTNYLVHHFKVLKDYLFAYDATDNNEGGIKNNKKYYTPKAKI